MTNDQIKDIQFLIDLQKELNSQENDSQANPRFWSVGDYRWVACSEGNAERYTVFFPDSVEAHEIDYFLNKVLDKEDLSEEEIESLNDADCTDSKFEWIQDNYDSEASLHPEREEHFVRENTMFLTKEEAKLHIKQNSHHYSNRAHTYAMTAWRAPKVERLLKILGEFDFEGICGTAAIGTAE
ncbi:hypothetical protein QP794_01760 [Paenibacillus sp. UMB7766-LJ446]|uniref:hypothetical protein n=1 Tax=Paenibacillus sp. UMB7766-LJ446 TaxID=3046313 RepID=UPI00254D0065|nr:hypothetical protein [Paenibacillus sp. UMB7766-LJ446]MDK8188808.1 hypothetical protein [Paenibacillus sp. UMB7766-LJ446]